MIQSIENVVIHFFPPIDLVLTKLNVHFSQPTEGKVIYTTPLPGALTSPQPFDRMAPVVKNVKDPLGFSFHSPSQTHLFSLLQVERLFQHLGRRTQVNFRSHQSGCEFV